LQVLRIAGFSAPTRCGMALPRDRMAFPCQSGNDMLIL